MLDSYPALCDRSCVEQRVGLAFNLSKSYQVYFSTRRDPICMNVLKFAAWVSNGTITAIRAHFCKVVVYPFHGEIVFAFIIIVLGICGEIILASMFKGGSRGWGTGGPDPYPLENHKWL